MIAKTFLFGLAAAVFSPFLLAAQTPQPAGKASDTFGQLPVIEGAYIIADCRLLGQPVRDSYRSSSN